MIRSIAYRFKDALWLLLLLSYILAGTSEVPFHGDESTTIWMTRDYHFVFVEGNLQQVRYNDPPIHQTGQHMRLITGSLTKYLMGFAWHLNGYDIEDINEQWDWGGDWEYNQSNNHAPDDTLLMLGRLPSTLMLATGVVIIFLIGMQLGGRPVAYLASLYYALHPVLLLNGRRAMFEGGLILFSLLVVLAAIWLLQNRRWRYAILLAIASGLAVSAKHTAVFTLIPVFAASFAYAMIWIKDRKEKITLLTQLFVAGILAFAIFYLLNPIWWGDPIQRTEQVYEARKEILDGQVAAFGGYENFVDQIAGFGRQTFIAKAQYYEAPVWEDYIGDQINSYESAIWHGISFGETLPGAIIMALLSCAGLWTLWQSKNIKMPTKLIVGTWSIVILIESALLTPLEWQRYYLMTYPVIGLLAALGLVRLLSLRQSDNQL